MKDETTWRIRSIGFTGTRKGMTLKQRERVKEILNAHRPTAVHHGDCLGADAEFHHIVETDHCPDTIIIVHPPLNDKDRAWCAGDQVLEEKEYLDRNKDIVDAADLVIATPAQRTPQARGSGTWHTVRYARRKGTPLITVYP